MNIFGNHLVNRNGSSKNCDLGTQLRIGDRVQSCKFGDGVIRGLGPNGNVIVRFDVHKKSQVIFPSFLKKLAP